MICNPLSRTHLSLLLALLGALAPMPALAHSMLTSYLELIEKSDGTTAVTWRTPAVSTESPPYMPVFPKGVKPQGETVRQEEPSAIVLRFTVSGAAPGWAGSSIGISAAPPAGSEALVRFSPVAGEMQLGVLRTEADIFTISARPSRLTSAFSYLLLGVDHILTGVDHLLFVLGLLLIVRSRLTLVKTITAFTVAHSITLGLATLGYAAAPLPPLNLAIALSILFLGPEIARAGRGETSLTIRQPWIVAFCFGLLHGFGFATGLQALGLPRTDIPLALLLFNIGVEVGQLGFILAIVLLGRGFRSLQIVWPAWALALPRFVVGGLGAFWTIQRATLFFAALK